MNAGYADRILQDALIAASSGLDLDLAAGVLEDCLHALKKQAAALREATYDPAKAEAVAKAMNHTEKTVNELARLVQFARGQPDSRPELGGTVLQGLTDAQLTQVQHWIEENQRRDEAQEAELDENPAESGI